MERKEDLEAEQQVEGNCDTGMLIPTEQQSSESSCDKDLQPDLTNKLCHEALLKVFQWLPVEDLISVQRVCHSWRVSALDSSVWNTHTLTLEKRSHHTNIKNLNIMPGVRNIDGYAKNDIVYLILKKVRELKRLNCEFHTPLTLSQVAQLIEAYPEMESISLDISATDIVESIEKLKSSEQRPKEICFCLRNIYNGGRQGKAVEKITCQENMLKLFKVLSDLNNFTAIKSLDLKHCGNKDIFGEVKCNDIVAHVIEKRSLQLFSLKVEASANIITHVNTCANLKELYLTVDENLSVRLSIDKMSNLEILDINVKEKDNYFLLTELESSFSRSSWPHLMKISLTLYFPEELQLLREIIKNVKLLKKLTYYDYAEVTGEEQIEEITSLTKLENLTIHGLKTLTVKALNSISNCTKLKSLILFACKSVTEYQYLHMANMVRRMERLKYCAFRTDFYLLSFNGRASIEQLLSEF